jgi:hypothetical protein
MLLTSSNMGFEFKIEHTNARMHHADASHAQSLFGGERKR